MKKILRIFAFCVAFMSSGELVHAQVFVKTDAVKSVWSDYDFNEQGTTLESVIVFCMNKSGATISDCRDKVKQIVANHNQIIKHDKSVQVPLSNEKSNPSENKISQIIITRDLDDGTPVSGDCASEIIVKSGTPIKLNCDAAKKGKPLTGYVDNYGHKLSKNWQFGFEDIISQAEYNSELYPKSLKAVYGESGTQERVIDNVHDNDRNLIELNNWETRAVQPAETLQHMDQPPVYYNGDGDKKNAEQESGDDKNTNNTQSVVTTKEDKSSETYKYACDYNTGARDKVRLKKASDAKTAADLNCVFSYYNKCRTFFGNRAIPDVAKSMFDISKKQGLYYCEKTENFKKNSFAVCCSIRGENVECKPGKQYSVDFMQDIKASFNDCK